MPLSCPQTDRPDSRCRARAATRARVGISQVRHGESLQGPREASAVRLFIFACQHFLSRSQQYPPHGFIGRAVALGDLAQRLPLRDTLQDDGPLCRRNFEEGNRWFGMRWFGWKGL